MRRRQATVVFNDISGYTSLMQKNEDHAILLRQRHKEVVDRLTTAHHGTIIQYYGDGTLSIFDRASDAILCALSMQLEFAQVPQVPLRIGINAGDILLGPDGIYGDSVNIASRIERICVPGSILISSSVYDQIRQDNEIKTKDLGAFELKNVRTPIHIHAVCHDGIFVPEPQDLAGKLGFKEKTVMVLPFYNLSPDPEDDFFSDGITEQIITSLSELEGIRVTSRTSSFTFKDKQINLRQLHQEIGIDHVLEGSVRRHGKKVRITAQLIHAADDFHLWSETFTRELEDVFQLQDEIACKISNKLKAGFQQSMERRIVAQEDEPSTHSDVYEHYHRGRFEWKQKQPGFVDRSIHSFKQAVEADRDFYLAWPSLAKAYAFKCMYNQMLPAEAARLSEECLGQASRIDDDNPRTQNGWALHHVCFTWRWDLASKHIEQSGKVHDKGEFVLNNAVLHTSALYHLVHRRYDEAIRLLKKACKLDPVNPALHLELSKALLYSGDDEKALEVVAQVLHMRPDYHPAFELQGWILFDLGRQREGIESFRRFNSLSTFPLAGLAGLAYAHARTSRMTEAHKQTDLLEAVGQDLPGSLTHYDRAIAFLGQLEYDKMFDELQLALNARMPSLIFIDCDPVWDEIRRFHRYAELKSRIFGIINQS